MLNDKMNALIEEVCGELAEREELVHTIALTLLTGKNLFVLGEPGQAKSQAIDLFRSHITGAKQFDILMSKGTDQEQLFGRLDLASIIPGHVSHAVLNNDPRYAQMRKRLAERYGSSGRVIALPFTDRVADYMAACDVMLSKPGGLTSTEAAALNVPLIHTDPIPGCETRNAAFFQEHGMSLRAVGTEEIAQTAASLLYNAPLQQAMIQAQAKTINAYAARDAIDLALERCTSPGV